VKNSVEPLCNPVVIKARVGEWVERVMARVGENPRLSARSGGNNSKAGDLVLSSYPLKTLFTLLNRSATLILGSPSPRVSRGR
jgi:hypothetical protein